MKRLTILLAVIAITQTNCKKNHTDDAPPTTSDRNFDITFNGTEYKGTNPRFGSPQKPTIKYQTMLLCTLWWTPDFYVRIDNAPAQGKVDFCTSGCDPQNGDIILSFFGDNIMETNFSGSMEYISGGKVKIDAVSPSGKILTGTIQYE